ALVVPQVVGGALALDLAVHRHLEQDRSDDAVATEGGAGDDAGAHLMDQVEHLVFTRVGALLDPVQLQRLGRAPTALIEGGDEALTGADLLELLLVHGRFGPPGGGRIPPFWPTWAPGGEPPSAGRWRGHGGG